MKLVIGFLIAVILIFTAIAYVRARDDDYLAAARFAALNKRVKALSRTVADFRGDVIKDFSGTDAGIATAANRTMEVLNDAIRKQAMLIEGSVGKNKRASVVLGRLLSRETKSLEQVMLTFDLENKAEILRVLKEMEGRHVELVRYLSGGDMDRAVQNLLLRLSSDPDALSRENFSSQDIDDSLQQYGVQLSPSELDKLGLDLKADVASGVTLKSALYMRMAQIEPVMRVVEDRARFQRIATEQANTDAFNAFVRGNEVHREAIKMSLSEQHALTNQMSYDATNTLNAAASAHISYTSSLLADQRNNLNVEVLKSLEKVQSMSDALAQVDAMDASTKQQLEARARLVAQIKADAEAAQRKAQQEAEAKRLAEQAAALKAKQDEENRVREARERARVEAETQARALEARVRAEAEMRERARLKAIADEAARQKAIADEQARQRAIAEEQARQKAIADEAARQKAIAEEQARQKAIAAEQARQKAIAEEQARQKAIAEEQARQKAIAAEQARQKAIAEEQARQKAIAAEQARQNAIAAEQARQKAIAEEQARQKAIAEEQARQKAIADEQARQKAIADEQARQKAIAEEQARKKAIEEEALRKVVTGWTATLVKPVIWMDGASFVGGVWRDKSGRGNDSTRAENVSVSNNALSGGTNSGVEITRGWPGGDYTFVHVTRYTGASRGRIWNGKNSNWLSGHWNGHAGWAHHGRWLEPNRDLPADNWVLTVDQRSFARFNATNESRADGTTPGGVGINQFGGEYNNERSDWACAEIVVFEGNLSDGDIRAVENYLINKYGMPFKSVPAQARDPPPVWRDTWENFATIFWGHNSEGVHDFQALNAKEFQLLSPLPKGLTLVGSRLQGRADVPKGTYPGPKVRAINEAGYIDRQMGPITVR